MALYIMLPWTRVWWAQHAMVVLLWVGYCSCYIIRMPLSLIKEDLGTELSISPELLGCLDASLLLPYALISMTMGSLADQFPPNIIAGMGLAFSALSTAFFGYLKTLTFMPLLLFLTGAFQALCWPATVAVTDNWFPPQDHNYALGLLGTSSFGGSLISTYFIVFIESQSGWRSIFMPCSVIAGTVGILVTLFALPPSKYGIVIKDSADDFAKQNRISFIDAESMHRKTPFTLRNLMCHELVPLAAFSMFCNKFVRYALMFWLPMFLQHNLGYTNLGAGLGSTSFDYGGVAGNLFNGFFVKLFKNNWSTAVAGNLGACAFTFIFTFAGNCGTTIHMILLFLTGTCISLSDLILTGPIPSKLGKPSGSTLAVSGFINGAGSVGAVLQGPLIGLIVTVGGWDACLALLIVLTAIAAMAAYIAKVRADAFPHWVDT